MLDELIAAFRDADDSDQDKLRCLALNIRAAMRRLSAQWNLGVTA